MSYPGTVIVENLSIENLPSMDVGGSSDPYIVVQCGGTEQRTKPMNANLNPQFSERLMNIFDDIYL